MGTLTLLCIMCNFARSHYRIMTIANNNYVRCSVLLCNVTQGLYFSSCSPGPNTHARIPVMYVYGGIRMFMCVCSYTKLGQAVGIKCYMALRRKCTLHYIISWYVLLLMSSHIIISYCIFMHGNCLVVNIGNAINCVFFIIHCFI